MFLISSMLISIGTIPSVFIFSTMAPNSNTLSPIDSRSLMFTQEVDNLSKLNDTTPDIEILSNTELKNNIISNISKGSIDSPSIDVDKKSGLIYITFLQTLGNETNLYLVKSADNGTTFSDPIRINNLKGDATANANFGPKIMVNTDGELYALWTKTEYSKRADDLGFGLFGLSSLRISKSVDQGSTFSPAVQVKDGNMSQIFGSFETAPDKAIYVSWISQPSEDSLQGSSVKLSVSSDGAKTFSNPKVLDSPVNQCDNVNLAADNSSSIYVSWRKIFDVPGNVDPDHYKTVRDMVLTNSSSHGKFFSLPHKISNDKFMTGQCITAGAPMKFDNKGTLHTLWYTGKENAQGIYYAKSNDDGLTFSTPKSINTGSFVPPSKFDMDIDEMNNVWIVWEKISDSNNDVSTHGAQNLDPHNTNGSQPSHTIKNETKDENINPENEIYLTNIDSVDQNHTNAQHIADGQSPTISTFKNLNFITWLKNNTLQFKTIVNGE